MAAVLMALLCLPGCVAFAPQRVTTEAIRHFRTIQSLDLTQVSKTRPVTLEEAIEQRKRQTGGEANLPTLGMPREVGAGPSTADAIPEPDLDGPAVDLTLEEARAAALANNLDLKVQFVNPTIARQVISEAAGVFQPTFLLPWERQQIKPPPGNISFGTQVPATMDTLDPAVNVPLTTGGTFRLEGPITRDKIPHFNGVDTTGAFSFSQPLLAGGGINPNTAGIQIAQVNYGIANTRAKLAAVQVLADVERAYWNLYQALGILEIAQTQLSIGKEQVRVAERLIEANIQSDVDRLRALTGLYPREVDLVAAQTNVKIAARNLRRIMLRPDLPVPSRRELRVVTPPTPLGLNLDRPSLVERGFQNRMDLAEFELDIVLEAVNIMFQGNAALPRLDATTRIALLGTGNSLGRSYETLFGNDYHQSTIGVSAVVPLPFGVNAAPAARRREAILRQLQDALSRDRIKVSIKQDVNNAVDRLEQTWQQILFARQGVLNATQAYEAELRLFKLGQRTSTDVLIAADRLALNQQNEVNAITNYQLARVDLAVATGTMLGLGQVEWGPVGDQPFKEWGPRPPVP